MVHSHGSDSWLREDTDFVAPYVHEMLMQTRWCPLETVHVVVVLLDDKNGLVLRVEILGVEPDFNRSACLDNRRLEVLQSLWAFLPHVFF